MQSNLKVCVTIFICRINLLMEIDEYQPSTEQSARQMNQEATVSQSAKALPERNIFVDALIVFFGIGSWIGVTSTFIQLPLIVPTAPEGWSLPSYLTITIQSANIGSFAYLICQYKISKKLHDGYLIYLVMTIGCIAALCMAFLYQNTTELNGSQHSVALIVNTFVFALVGCMSSVLFMPYMGRFRECYLVTYMFGMGLNGFVSSIMALIQGVGGVPNCLPNNSTDGPEFIKYVEPPLFGTKLYFLIVFAILVLSTIAFILLNNLAVCKKEYAAGTIGIGNDYHYDEKEKTTDNFGMIPDDVRNLSTFNYIYLMATVVGLSGLGNGLFPGLMTYSCLPYGNITYHFTVTLAAMANPLAGFIAMFIPHTSIRVIRILSVIGSITAFYILYISVQSPHPLLQNSMFGSLLIVCILIDLFQI